MPSVSISPIEPADFAPFLETCNLALGADFRANGDPRLHTTVEPPRWLAAFDNGRIVGTSATLGLNVSIPGGTTSMAGLTMVGVLPSHRRQGIMRDMMHMHFQQARERGDSLVGLWASEAAIYHRFGFGIATYAAETTIRTQHASLSPAWTEPGTVEFIDAKTAGELFPPVYEAIRDQSPGLLARSPAWWSTRSLNDFEALRGDAGLFRFAVYKEDGQPRGYVQFRRTRGWDDGYPTGRVKLVELMGDGTARRALWRFVLGQDLVVQVDAMNLPMNEPLSWWLNDPRAVRQKAIDGLWIRIIDAPGTLTRRRYMTEGSLVLELSDTVCSWNPGRYLLEVGPDGATCQKTEQPTDIRLDATSLASVYMGTHRVTDLAAAGRITGSPKNLHHADTLFSWDRQPWCADEF